METLKLEDMCRICMRCGVDMVPLFQAPPDADDRTYPDLIMAVTAVKIADEVGLPRQFCTDCAVKLNSAFDFKSLCEKSESFYKEYLLMQSHDPNTIKQEMVCELTYEITDIAMTAAPTEYNENEFLIFKSEPEHRAKPRVVSAGISVVNSTFVPTTHNCEYCGFVATDSKLLTEHHAAFHKNKAHGGKLTDGDQGRISSKNPESVQLMSTTAGGAIATIKEEVGQNENTLVLQVTYRCPICNIQYENQQSYAAHMTKHSGRLPRGVSEFKCHLCNKVFVKRKNLKQHVLTHSAEKANKCTLCHRSFTRPDQLVLHMNNHTGKKRHQCPHCQKGFNMLSTLKDHLRTHSGEKPYLCSICGKGFTQNTNLKQHLMRHSAIKPFGCDTCQSKFVSKGELDAHARKHTGDHPFVCDVCGAGFTTSSSLVKHKRIHTGEKPYVCDLCQMRFTALGTLKNHRRTHTGEKPFPCTHCSRAFAQKSDLVSHLRTHTGERPYACGLCHLQFHQLSQLKLHTRNYHPLGKPEETVPVLKISPDNSNSNFISCVESTD